MSIYTLQIAVRKQENVDLTPGIFKLQGFYKTVTTIRLLGYTC
jgi:hypothetical protein